MMAMFGRHGEAPVAILAPQSPSDCYEIMVEAARIALTYRTPVMVLSDGYIANGAEPWRLPEIAELPDISVEFATETNGVDAKGEPVFLPYLRDFDTLARPWAVPGTPGLQHRIGGIEKADKTGDISYDPENHDHMVRTRAAKIARVEVPDLELDDPTGDAEVLVLGWGSTWGPIGAAVRGLRDKGVPIARAHLRYLNPMPKNTAEILARYDRVVVPEMNLGQLALLLRGNFPGTNVVGYNKVRGLPFTSNELQDALEEVIKNG